MNEIISKLSRLVEEVPKKLAAFSETELTVRPSPNKWSKKEILGHLCDSAINNLSRFIKAQIEEQPCSLTRYEQNQWVLLQNYQNTQAEEIAELWVLLNKSVIRVISAIPQEKYNHVCKLYNEDETFTLQWLISDYVEHMEHHLKQIFSSSI